MALAIRRLGDALGAAVEGIDLNAPLDAAAAGQLQQAQLQHLVLAIRSQSLAPQAYLAAMRLFGKPVAHQPGAALHPELREIMVLFERGP
jgi:alpha-ketoglutarate-dependent taurine dioxygenase